jgi:hypothetical protein
MAASSSQRGRKGRSSSQTKGSMKQKQPNSFRMMRARNIRLFVSAYKEMVVKKKGEIEPGSESDKWITWANNQADRLDPPVEIPPSIMGEREEGW